MLRRLSLLSIVLLAGCRGSPSESARPSWIKRGSNLEHPDYVYVVGTCRGQPDADRARRCAVEDANQQLRTVFNVRGGLVRDEHHESRMGSISRGNQTVFTVVHDAWVLVAYPRSKLGTR